jgi:hypothetical protein
LWDDWTDIIETESNLRRVLLELCVFLPYLFFVNVQEQSFLNISEHFYIGCTGDVMMEMMMEMKHEKKMEMMISTGVWRACVR